MVPGVLQDHLLLLNGVETGLTDVICGLPEPLVHPRAECVGPSLLDAVGLDQPCLDQPLQNLTSGDFIALNLTGETARFDPALVAQEDKSNHRIDG